MDQGIRALLAIGLTAALANGGERNSLFAPEDDWSDLECEAAPAWAPTPPIANSWIYGGAEYIFWWLREGRLPATLTTGAPASQGVLGQPDTKLLYGDSRLDTRHDDQFNGVRVNLGFWCDDAQTIGIEGSAFFLERDSTYFKAVSDGSTLLARVYELPNGSPASDIIAGPSPTGLRSGGFVGYSRVELFGEEANAVASLVRDGNWQLEALCGARFLQMRDRTDLTATGYALPDQETLYGLTDHYRTHNAYYGAQVGLCGTLTCGAWFADLRGTIGLGGNAEQVQEFGDSTYQTPLEKIVTPTGLTVQANNTGTFNRAALNMVSEARFNLGYRLTRHLPLFGGYTFLLWDGPVRSGDQVNLVVDPTAHAPSIPFKEDVFWAQGLNAGLEFAW